MHLTKIQLVHNIRITHIELKAHAEHFEVLTMFSVIQII